MVPAAPYAHRLTHNRNHGPLGDCHTKFQREGEQQQYGQAVFARRRLDHRLANGKQAHFEALDKQRQAENNTNQPTENAAKLRNRLAQDNDLKNATTRTIGTRFSAVPPRMPRNRYNAAPMPALAALKTSYY